MPTYDYHCGSCNKRYELRESFSAPMEHTCEKCKKGTAKRVLTAPRVVFKGSGWYVTDSRNKTTAMSDNDPGGGESKSESASGSKSESKSGSKKGDKAAKSESSSSASSSSSSSSSSETSSAAS